MHKMIVPLMLLGLSHGITAASIGTGGLSTAFSKDTTSIGIVVGSGSAFNNNYIILGAGVGYYVAKGLEVGIDAQYWLSDDPSITKVTPKLTYVFTQSKLLSLI